MNLSEAPVGFYPPANRLSGPAANETHLAVRLEVEVLGELDQLVTLESLECGEGGEGGTVGRGRGHGRPCWGWGLPEGGKLPGWVVGALIESNGWISYRVVVVVEVCGVRILALCCGRVVARLVD